MGIQNGGFALELQKKIANDDIKILIEKIWVHLGYNLIF
jgi:hypothetical protein